ncbi:sensor histidine kinase [Fibrella aestuarina]|nr:ATP-binding protein [Fibrella aestuarina]
MDSSFPSTSSGTPPPAYPFLQGGGEMGLLTRQFDWSTTSLGEPGAWSSSLRTLVNMMLTSRFPMLIFWGPGLITFYNDAFRPSLGNNGKHPASLGQRGEVSWAESWPVIGPMIHGIMAGGDAVWFEDQKLPIYREGVMDYAYWTYSFSPLIDDTAAVNGVLVTCSETTQAVKSRDELAESEQRYRTLAADLEQQVDGRTEQLQASVLDLQRSNENLQQFAYVASHDLQEPLRKIQSFGDLLKTQYAQPLGDGVKHLERMQLAANRMSTLIRDLLAFSRISTRQETHERVSLTNLLNAVLADLDLIISEAGAAVEVAPLPTIRGDTSQLGQLFQNLLSNALKFRREGVAPVVSVRYESVMSANVPASVKPTRHAATYYRIDVADNGIGFDEKYTQRIFQVFQRLHSRANFPGTGIGLAICQKVAENHGGTLSASSQPDRGATFSVYLPAI